jgi:uncharacterized membrane protein HdeD (DUF308 family)
MHPILLGASSMAALVAALFFLRFWRDAGDRFFLFFAIAFGVDGLNRLILALSLPTSAETEPFFYLVRLFSFVIILAAIVDKNRK